MTTLTPPSKKSIFINLAIALAAAAVVLVFAILPAEYNIDPTGIGKLLGFTELAETEETADEFDQTFEPVVSGTGAATYSHQRPANNEVFEILLKPFDEVEYKATLALGEPLIYSWSTSQGKVYYDFHGEPSHPEEFEEGFFQSYEEKQEGASEAHGSFIAPFEGHHGWYWLNDNEFDVTIRLHAIGYYEELVELYRSNQLAGPYEQEE